MAIWMLNKRAVKNFLRPVLLRVPARHVLDKICRFYCDTVNGENLADMARNGEIQFLKSQGNSCHVLFDVGASRGEWTRHAVAVTAALEIHCFEPVPSLYDGLEHASFPSWVVRNPFGLSDMPEQRLLDLGTASLYHDRGPITTSSRPQTKTQLVTLKTLDAYCGERGIEHIDFLKIDVEGHELAVLKGGRRMIEDDRVSRIQFEYSRWNIAARVLLLDLFEFFHALPYDLYKLTPRGLVATPRYDREQENFRYKNFVALHRSIVP